MRGADLAYGRTLPSLANLASGDLHLMLAPMITAWGRKPT
jgi:hypothetical protein